MKKLQFQQGDVCIFSAVIPFPTIAIEKNCPNHKVVKVQGNVLREGEATGHAHAIEGTDFQLYKLGQRLFTRILSGDCRVVHEEHKPINLPIGDYEVTPVHEYDHFREEARYVRD